LSTFHTRTAECHKSTGPVCSDSSCYRYSVPLCAREIWGDEITNGDDIWGFELTVRIHGM